MIYLDNAATSWPKPACVSEAMQAFLRDIGASPGRSGHRLANGAEGVRLDAREAIAELFGVKDAMRVVFMLNATAALNLVIRGMLPPGSHVVTTSMEHNSVMRPIRDVEARGASVSIAPCHADGTLDPGSIEGCIRPETRLIIVNHASNVCGTILPIREIGEIARRRAIPLCVDAAQTAGVWPIDMKADHIDLLAFTGHKGLLGPPGTGGLVIGDAFQVSKLPPLTTGGTGSRSEHEIHPDFLPDRFESGTPNTVGLAGLQAGVRYLLSRGVEKVRKHERDMAARLIEGLRDIEGVRVVGRGDADRQTAVVSFIADGCETSELAAALDERFEIMCRPGLQCAPAAHRTLGTFPDGTVRFCPGILTTHAEIDEAIQAVRAIVHRGSRP